MARIGIIACSATKLMDEELHMAQDLYQGALFIKARAYVERTCDAYLILSALHNTLLPTDRVRTYDHSFKSRAFDVAGQRRWNNKTFAQLEDRLDAEDTLVCLASAPYRGWLDRSPWNVEVPMQGLMIGQQLSYLKSALAL